MLWVWVLVVVVALLVVGAVVDALNRRRGIDVDYEGMRVQRRERARQFRRTVVARTRRTGVPDGGPKA